MLQECQQVCKYICIVYQLIAKSDLNFETEVVVQNCCTDFKILGLTDGREWFPISFHKSLPVKYPTVKKVKMPVYLVLKENEQLC